MSDTPQHDAKELHPTTVSISHKNNVVQGCHLEAYTSLFAYWSIKPKAVEGVVRSTKSSLYDTRYPTQIPQVLHL